MEEDMNRNEHLENLQNEIGLKAPDWFAEFAVKLSSADAKELLQKLEKLNLAELSEQVGGNVLELQYEFLIFYFFSKVTNPTLFAGIKRLVCNFASVVAIVSLKTWPVLSSLVIL